MPHGSPMCSPVVSYGTRSTWARWTSWAGNPTKAGGETRTFRTTGLSGSKGWDNYTVRVELNRGGQTVTKEETISLKAGESQELRFDFDGDKIASAR